MIRPLSPRELQVLALQDHDLTPTEIAMLLTISRSAVRTYIARIEAKQETAA